MKVKQEVKYIRDGRAPIPKKESTSRVMSANKAKNTKPEMILRKMLWHSGLKGYRLHWEKVPGRPDIAYPKRKVAIFINGCFWHRCPHCNLPLPKSNIEFWRNKFNKNKERDKRKEQALKKVGWKVFTIWECTIKKDPDKVIKEVKKYLK